MAPVMDQAAAPGAQSRSEPAADRNRAVDRPDPLTAKNAQRGRRYQWPARTDHAAEADHEAGEQPVIRIPLQQPQQDDTHDRDAIAEQHRRPAADQSVQGGDAEHADHRHDAGKTPGRCRLQRRKAGIDQIGDDLRGDGVHRDCREEEGGEQRPEGVVAHRAHKRPVVLGKVRIGFLDDVRRAGGEQPPRQQEDWQQQTERDRAEQLIGVPPSDAVDQDLRGRQQHQDAGAGGRIDDRHRRRQPGSEPAAEQDRVRHVADQRDAEPDAEADAELELPERLRMGRDQERAAKQKQPERVDAARPRTIEQAADQRRGQPAGEPGQRIDRNDLRAVPAKTFRDRFEEDGKTLTQAAAEHRQRKAQRQHVERDARRLWRLRERLSPWRILIH